MRSILLFIAPALIMLLVIACKSPRDSIVDKIQDIENKLYADTTKFEIDQEMAAALTAAYEDFVQQFPADTDAAPYLFKAADIYRSTKKFGRALTTYNRIEREYPDYDKAAHSLFLQGFIYETNLADLDKARQKYNSFLEKYPDHDLADDVQFSIKNLGLTPEEIIRQFEIQQQAADSIEKAKEDS